MRYNSEAGQPSGSTQARLAHSPKGLQQLTVVNWHPSASINLSSPVGLHSGMPDASHNGTGRHDFSMTHVNAGALTSEA